MHRAGWGGVILGVISCGGVIWCVFFSVGVFFFLLFFVHLGLF